ncbi:MAG: hypothetical protein M3N49_04020 [Candidatus Eremiobacteraeota bacterium]|nr:hypothetical protein [Candidatus Eremiobacteraeota bacterium]
MVNREIRLHKSRRVFRSRNRKSSAAVATPSAVREIVVDRCDVTIVRNVAASAQHDANAMSSPHAQGAGVSTNAIANGQKKPEPPSAVAWLNKTNARAT